MGEKKASRFGFYLGLTELADEHRDIIVLDADLPKTTGSEAFRKAHPERFLNVGISEQNMVGMCAGLARVGYVPFCGSMAVFAAGRAFEIIRNSVAYPSLNVKIVGSHGGITAAGDGGTHQCIEDLAIMRALPNMVVLSPCDSNQAAKLARIAYEHDGPVYVRTSREPTEDITTMDDEIELGKAQKLLDGEDLCIVSTGMMSVIAHEAAKELQAEGISCSMLNIHTIKPFDSETVRKEVARCHGRVLVAEEHNCIGGLGDAVARSLVGMDGISFEHIAVEDRFGQSGATAELLAAYGMTKENVADKARALTRG